MREIKKGMLGGNMDAKALMAIITRVLVIPENPGDRDFLMGVESTLHTSDHETVAIRFTLLAEGLRKRAGVYDAIANELCEARREAPEASWESEGSRRLTED